MEGPAPIVRELSELRAAYQNEQGVIARLQTSLDVQADHIRLLRHEVEMWESRACLDYGDTATLVQRTIEKFQGSPIDAKQSELIHAIVGALLAKKCGDA